MAIHVDLQSHEHHWRRLVYGTTIRVSAHNRTRCRSELVGDVRHKDAECNLPHWIHKVVELLRTGGDDLVHLEPGAIRPQTERAVQLRASVHSSLLGARTSHQWPGGEHVHVQLHEPRILRSKLHIPVAVLHGRESECDMQERRRVHQHLQRRHSLVQLQLSCAILWSQLHSVRRVSVPAVRQWRHMSLHCRRRLVHLRVCAGLRWSQLRDQRVVALSAELHSAASRLLATIDSPITGADANFFWLPGTSATHTGLALLPGDYSTRISASQLIPNGVASNPATASALMNMPLSFTVLMWMRPSSMPALNQAMALIDFHAATNNASYPLPLNTSYLELYLYQSYFSLSGVGLNTSSNNLTALSSNQFNFASTVQANKWFHVAMTVNASNNIASGIDPAAPHNLTNSSVTIYLNGALLSSITLPTLIMPVLRDEVWIGSVRSGPRNNSLANGSALVQSPFSGSIDSLHYFDYAMPSSLVRSIYQLTVPAPVLQFQPIINNNSLSYPADVLRFNASTPSDEPANPSALTANIVAISMANSSIQIPFTVPSFIDSGLQLNVSYLTQGFRFNAAAFSSQCALNSATVFPQFSDACSSRPCANNGVCTTLDPSKSMNNATYKCTCPTGFTGVQCEIPCLTSAVQTLPPIGGTGITQIGLPFTVSASNNASYLVWNAGQDQNSTAVLGLQQPGLLTKIELPLNQLPPLDISNNTVFTSIGIGLHRPPFGSWTDSIRLIGFTNSSTATLMINANRTSAKLSITVPRSANLVADVNDQVVLHFQPLVDSEFDSIDIPVTRHFDIVQNQYFRDSHASCS